MASVDDVEAEELVGVELSPVHWISPHTAHAFAGIEHEAPRRTGPGLRSLDLAYRPFHAAAIHHDVWIQLVGRAPVGGEDMAIRVDTPGHQNHLPLLHEGGDVPRPTVRADSLIMKASCRDGRIRTLFAMKHDRPVTVLRHRARM